MLNILFEHEIKNNIANDGINEYCMSEGLNEEYFRYVLRKNDLNSKHVIKNLIILLRQLYSS